MENQKKYTSVLIPYKLYLELIETNAGYSAYIGIYSTSGYGRENVSILIDKKTIEFIEKEDSIKKLLNDIIENATKAFQGDETKIRGFIKANLLLAINTRFDKLSEKSNELNFEESEGDECPECGEKLQSKMIDIDGTNLEERKVCESCQYGYPSNYFKDESEVDPRLTNRFISLVFTGEVPFTTAEGRIRFPYSVESVTEYTKSKNCYEIEEKFETVSGFLIYETNDHYFVAIENTSEEDYDEDLLLNDELEIGIYPKYLFKEADFTGVVFATDGTTQNYGGFHKTLEEARRALENIGSTWIFYPIHTVCLNVEGPKSEMIIVDTANGEIEGVEILGESFIGMKVKEFSSYIETAFKTKEYMENFEELKEKGTTTFKGEAVDISFAEIDGSKTWESKIISEGLYLDITSLKGTDNEYVRKEASIRIGGLATVLKQDYMGMIFSDDDNHFSWFDTNDSSKDVEKTISEFFKGLGFTEIDQKGNDKKLYVLNF